VDGVRRVVPVLVYLRHGDILRRGATRQQGAQQQAQDDGYDDGHALQAAGRHAIYVIHALVGVVTRLHPVIVGVVVINGCHIKLFYHKRGFVSGKKGIGDKFPILSPIFLFQIQFSSSLIFTSSSV
jgi:hypothetical protein